MVEECEHRKRSEDAHESHRESCDGSRLGDGEPRPRVEEARQRAVSIANVNVFAASLRLHGAELGIGDGARQRQYAADDPGEIDQPSRANGLHHLGRDQEDTAADDGADHDRAGMAYAQVTRKSGCWLCLVRRHCKSRLELYSMRNLTTLPIKSGETQNFLGVIRSAPIYGRSTSGINTLPSAC